MHGTVKGVIRSEYAIILESAIFRIVSSSFSFWFHFKNVKLQNSHDTLCSIERGLLIWSRGLSLTNAFLLSPQQVDSLDKSNTMKMSDCRTFLSPLSAR